MTKLIKVDEFHCDEPETSDIVVSLTRAFGTGEISGEDEYTTDWGGVFKFSLEKLDIGTTETYNVWILTAILNKGKSNV
jgi:hypothetical protein